MDSTFIKNWIYIVKGTKVLSHGTIDGIFILCKNNVLKIKILRKKKILC